MYGLHLIFGSWGLVLGRCAPLNLLDSSAAVLIRSGQLYECVPAITLRQVTERRAAYDKQRRSLTQHFWHKMGPDNFLIGAETRTTHNRNDSQLACDHMNKWSVVNRPQRIMINHHHIYTVITSNSKNIFTPQWSLTSVLKKIHHTKMVTWKPDKRSSQQN